MGISYELRKEEQEFKTYYKRAKSKQLPLVMSDSDFHVLLEKNAKDLPNVSASIFDTDLAEDTFFLKQMEVSAIQHFRYMPAVYHTHEFFELACVLDGTFENYIKDTCITLQRGDILILSPETEHALCCFEDRAILINILIRKTTFEDHFLNIFPEDDLLHNFYVKTLYDSPDNPYLLFRSGDDDKVREEVLSIFDEYEKSRRFKNTMLKVLLSSLFLTLLRDHEKDVIVPGAKTVLQNENALFILRYLQANYTTITLHQLAEFFNYSERQLQRIIHSMTGMTFSENIKKLRMSHAARYLSDSNLTVNEIAAQLGYYDSSSFRHQFREYYQVTPQEYRRGLRCDESVRST